MIAVPLRHTALVLNEGLLQVSPSYWLIKDEGTQWMCCSPASCCEALVKTCEANHNRNVDTSNKTSRGNGWLVLMDRCKLNTIQEILSLTVSVPLFFEVLVSIVSK